MTAAGVAGGAVLFEGIESIFGRQDAAGIIGNQSLIAGLGETAMGIEPGYAEAAEDRGLHPAGLAGQDYGSDHDFGAADRT